MNGNRSERAYNLRMRGASWGEIALACDIRCAAEAHRAARGYAEEIPLSLGAFRRRTGSRIYRGKPMSARALWRCS